jgi:ATP-dependent Clp protease ATP-binding subunit ClpA
LDQEDMLVSTVEFYLTGLIERFNEEYKPLNITLSIDLPKVSQFIVKEHGNEIREFGGRAVLNTIDDILLPLLAQRLVLFERSRVQGGLRLKIDINDRRNLCVRNV